MGGACSTHGEMRSAYTFFIGSLKGRDQSEDVGVDRKIILKWILRK
jgi:hypothetical protein